MNAGIRIKELRNQKGLTQERIVEIIGEDVLSLSTYKRIEDNRSPINISRLCHICRALGCRPTDILDEIDDKREIMKSYFMAGEG